MSFFLSFEPIEYLTNLPNIEDEQELFQSSETDLFDLMIQNDDLHHNKMDYISQDQDDIFQNNPYKSIFQTTKTLTGMNNQSDLDISYDNQQNFIDENEISRSFDQTPPQIAQNTHSQKTKPKRQTKKTEKVRLNVTSLSGNSLRIRKQVSPKQVKTSLNNISTEDQQSSLYKLQQCKRLKGIIAQMEDILNETKKQIVEQFLLDQRNQIKSSMKEE